MIGADLENVQVWVATTPVDMRKSFDGLAEVVCRSKVIHTDDTTVPIQSPGAKQCRKGHIWCYLGDEQNPYMVCEYTPSRFRDGRAKWLTGSRNR